MQICKQMAFLALFKLFSAQNSAIPTPNQKHKKKPSKVLPILGFKVGQRSEISNLLKEDLERFSSDQFF